MKNKIFKFFLVILFSLNFVFAQEVISKIQVNITRGEIWAVGGLVLALILVLIYWILQSRLSN